MSRQRPSQIKPTVATHFPSLSRGPEISQNVHMFTEDVHLGLMPIGGRTEKHKEFAVSLQGSEDECEKTRGLIGEIGRYDTHDLAEMVCDAVEEMARHLAWEGCAVYEIVLDDDGAPHVWSFTSKGLWRLPRWFLQVIPRGDWDLWKRKWTVVPASRIWYVDMPSILGGRTGYRRVLKRLGRFEPLGPQFWRKDLERGQQSKNFDFQGYVRQSEIYFDRITKAWGWNRRDWSQERSTEFFNVYKMVNFRWAQAVLREHMIAALNSLFARLGITCEVKVKGLPTVDDILNTKREFLDGRISFGAASGRVML